MYYKLKVPSESNFKAMIKMTNQQQLCYVSSRHGTHLKMQCTLDYLVFFKTYRTIGLRVRNNPLTNIPKGFGSEMTLEVAEGRLQVAGLCMLKTHAFAQFYAFCTKINAI